MEYEMWKEKGGCINRFTVVNHQSGCRGEGVYSNQSACTIQSADKKRENRHVLC